MQNSTFRTLARASVAAVAALLTGCQDKLSHKNFELIQQGFSTQHEVTQLIGDPDEAAANRWMYERPDKHLFAFVDFDEEGVVARKQWVDAKEAVWEDTRPDPEGRSSSETLRRQKGRR